jgi:hypothetical protein
MVIIIITYSEGMYTAWLLMFNQHPARYACAFIPAPHPFYVGNFPRTPGQSWTKSLRSDKRIDTHTHTQWDMGRVDSGQPRLLLSIDERELISGVIPVHSSSSHMYSQAIDGLLYINCTRRLWLWAGPKHTRSISSSLPFVSMALFSPFI